ncbi:MAG: hypothetical protein ACI815_002052 [Psychroserpens sp.]|jgi:hypothetical protein
MPTFLSILSFKLPNITLLTDIHHMLSPAKELDLGKKQDRYELLF